MRKIPFLFLTTCLILTNLTVGYTQDADIDALRASDVNADGVINIFDLTIVAAQFGTAPAADQPLNADVNGDGTVNIFDLTRVASHFGKTVPIRPPVAFISANPAIDSQLEVDDTITLTFDNTPEDITVNRGDVTTTETTVTIAGPFDPGSLVLTVTWADGTQTLNYTVRIPDTEAPHVISGTLSDGDTDVAPGAINNSGQIVVEFNEAVSGSIALQTESGADAGWLGKVDGNTATLQLISGKEIDNGTIYVIAGKVRDAAGNETELSITFTTIRPPIAFVSADPAANSQLEADDTITLTFDNPPEDVTVNRGAARIIGKRVRITGPFDPGRLALTVVWADGSQTLNYTVRVPDTDAPRITSTSVNNGAKDVDPEAFNRRGRIEVEFSEEVTGNVVLRTAAGADVGWRGKVDGKKATLELVRGTELGNDVTYVITGKVSDAAGNSTDINIRFTTAPKTFETLFEVTDATFNSRVLESEVPVLLEYVKDG